MSIGSVTTTAAVAWTMLAGHLLAQGAGEVAVEVQTIQAATVWETKSSFAGIVKAKRQSSLSFERPGRVDHIEVEEGVRVHAGDVLARLNTEQLQAQLQKLQADKRAAEALLAELQAGPRQETIDAAKASVREQEVQLDLAVASQRRRENLLKERLVAREEFDQAQTAVQRWEAARERAQKQLEDLELGTRPEKINSQQAIVQSLEAAIAAAQVELDHSVIKSPFDGSIIARNLDEGFVVSAGQPVLVISEDSVLQAHVGVPPALAQTLEPNAVARVLIRDQVIPARLKSVVAQVDQATRSQEVVATLSLSENQQVVPGDIARLEVARQLPVDGFWLNTSAVVQAQRGLWECFVVEPDKKSQNGKVARRTVEILQTEGDRILVRGAIQAGDRVIVSAIHRLSAGQKVKPIEKSATPDSKQPEKLVP